jgi:hypothetical protein
MDNYFKGCPAKMGHFRELTDYRPNDTTNQHIMRINGVVRDDDYRMMLQQNAETIMDRQFGVLKNLYSCQTNACIHNDPMTRTTPGSHYAELKRYNAVRTNQMKKCDANYPVCRNGPDYRMTHTNSCKY